MKRWAIGVSLLALAFGSSANATEHTTTQSGSYVFSGFFVEDCDMSLGVVCFLIGRSDLTTIHVEVDDASPFPVTGRVSVYGPGGVQIGGGDQFCESADIPVPSQPISQVVVHAGGVMEGECGPLPFYDPFDDKFAYLTPITTGTVTISY